MERFIEEAFNLIVQGAQKFKIQYGEIYRMEYRYDNFNYF